MIISENKEYLLKGPFNTWDMNYHLIEKETGLEYLIDIDDVANDTKELEEYGLSLVYFDLQSLDVDLIKENSWKTL